MRHRKGRGRHGQPAHHDMPPRPGYPLTMASSGEWVRVVSITTDHAAESRLVSMGINPGALLHVISSSGGPIVVARDETRYGIDRKTAWHVRVIPASSRRYYPTSPARCNDYCRGCSYRFEMLKAEYGNSITLWDLPPGETGTVTAVRGRGSTVKRLMEMGFVEGAKVRVVNRDTTEDRMTVEVNGATMKLGGWDAAHILLEADG